MPPRKPVTSEETASEETTAPSDEKSATIADVKAVVNDAIESIKGMFNGGTTEEPTTEEPEDDPVEDKLPSPRRVELDTQNAVEKALSGLTINVNSAREEKPETKEPETTPGGISKLTRFVWGKSA